MRTTRLAIAGGDGGEGQRKIGKERGGRERMKFFFFPRVATGLGLFNYYFLDRNEMPILPLIKGVKILFCPCF